MAGEPDKKVAVTPIGGLPEKLLAAQRAGITRVFIPADNEYDLKDVAQEVKDSIEIVPVKTVEDILRATGVMGVEE